MENNIELNKIDNYKAKYKKALIIVSITNIIIVLMIIALMLYNDLLFNVIGNIFISKDSPHVNDIAYAERLGAVAFIIYFIIFALIFAMYFSCAFLLKLENEDIVWFTVGGTKKENEYKELYGDEKHHFKRNGLIINVFKNILDYFRIINLAILTVTFIFTFILFPAIVNQSSMEPNLYEGNRVIVLISKKVNKNDIVVFKYDSDIQYKNASLNGDLLIKRVIATEGDIFECVSGKIYLNGTLLEEEYVNAYNIDHDSYDLLDIAAKNNNSEELIKLINENDGKIPSGYILCLGDNRAISNDSENFGLIKIDQVLGKVKFYKNEFGWNKISNN